MLPRQALVGVADESGAGWVQVFHVYRGSSHDFAYPGDFVKGAIRVIAFYPKYVRGKRYRPLRVGYVVRGLVTQARFWQRFFDGTRACFLSNAVAVLRRRGTLRAQATCGPLLRTVRRRQYETLFEAYL
jgi:ribosomal protein L14